ncbi:alpha/beta hydrolase [Propionibacteriaceae bacterium G1746]|uniref:alpha/beta hydrolase n=1 Tax=Aestuariimicrobium sp. G57 TaxID=3418485 RepID=UPI003C20EF70
MQWDDDSVLPGYQMAVLDLVSPELAPGEPEDTVISATLVRRNPPQHDRAVVYLHGWSDYFFQTWLADWYDAHGHDFYAVDLRRYGRSLREGQLGGYTTDVSDYYDELDQAVAEARREHSHVTLMAHSTGGLIAALWANDRPGILDGLVLNAPWIDFQGSPLLRSAAAAIAKNFGGRDPNRAAMTIPMPDHNIYIRSIHRSFDGEWDFDLSLKRNPAFTMRPGWFGAIALAQERVRRGLAIDVPVLVLLSARSDFGRRWKPEVQTAADTVLDVEKLARRAVQLGPNVTVVRIDGALHDVLLSRAEVRDRVWDAIERWTRAWLEDVRTTD